MRAVNLIPADERRGGAGVAGRSGSGVYLVLGALAALVIAVSLYVLTGNSIKSNQGKLAQVTERANRVEAQATALKAYRDFATLRQKRIATVTSLAASRFDWERTLRQLSQVLPADVWLTEFVGTVSPSVTVQSAGGGETNGLRQGIQAPAIQLVGCTENQSEVSRIMSRLRRMTGVTRVTLSVSEKPEEGPTTTPSTTGSTTGTTNTDCRTSSRIPRFQIVVFFRPLAGTPATGPGPGGAPPAQPAAPASSPSPQPVSGQGAGR